MRSLVLLFLSVLGCSSEGRRESTAVPAPDGGATVEPGPNAGGIVPDGSVAGPVDLASAPADLLFLIDRSSTWSTRSDRFEGAMMALTGFVAAHDDPFAVALFPKVEGSTCAASYDALDLPFAATSNALGTLLAGTSFGGDSPLGPALSGIGNVAREHAKLDRHRTTGLVIITDASPGEDEACAPKTFPEIAQLSASTFDGGHAGGVQVHVVSVMGKAVPPDHAPLLGDIAAKGGGYAAFVNGSRDDVARSARDALEDIRDQMRVCTRVVPDGVHPESLEVSFPDGTSTVAARVADAAACSSNPGFYLDDPEHPSTATLCSGEVGIGGYCQFTFWRARELGGPRVRVR